MNIESVENLMYIIDVEFQASYYFKMRINKQFKQLQMLTKQKK